MGNTEPRATSRASGPILPGATRALAMRRFAVVVELHRHADDVIAFGGKIAAVTDESPTDDAGTVGAFCRPRPRP